MSTRAKNVIYFLSFFFPATNEVILNIIDQHDGALILTISHVNLTVYVRATKLLSKKQTV